MPTILHLPAVSVNPYHRLLAEALESANLPCDLWFDPPRGKNPRRLLRRLKGAGIVHWHWLQGFYQGRNVATFFARSALFATVMAELRGRKVPQVVTVHNLLPHERSHEWLHRGMCRVVGAFADRLVVHHDDAVDPVASLYGHPEKIRVVPHLDYGAPEHSATVDELRTKWELTAYSKWAIVFGGLRRFKRIELAVRAAKLLHEEGIGLVVAGNCSDEDYRRLLENADEAGSVRFLFGRLPQEELSDLLLASDVALMPYSESLTSGAAYLALAHGLPIAATDALAFRELIREELCVPCDPADTVSLVNAVVAAYTMKAQQWEGRVAEFRRKRSLPVVGEQLAAVYRELCVLPAQMTAEEGA